MAENSTSTPVYLVDLSNYIFRAYHAIPNLRTKEGFPTGAVFGVAQMFAKLLEENPSAHIIAVKDAPGPSWRKEVYAEYKANRPPVPEDLKLQFPKVYDFVEALGIPTCELIGHEADDLIAGLATHFAGQGQEVIILSTDKDLMQFVGPSVVMLDTIRNTRYDAEAVEAKWGVGPEKIADFLALMGDSSDNVPGVAGVGKKRAAELLNTYGSIDAILSQVDDLPDRAWARSFRENPEVATLSYKLVKLDGSLPDEIKPEELVRRPVDEALFFALCTELEFATRLQQ